MKVPYTTIFLMVLFCMSGNHLLADENVPAPIPSEKKNVLTPVIGKENASSPVNPLLREQMSDDITNRKPVTGIDPTQTEPAVGKEFIEEWLVTSARTTTPGSIDKLYLMTSQSFMKVFDGKHLIFRLNENFPVQKGTYTQDQFTIKIQLDDSGCPSCIKDVVISRKTLNDKVYTIKFGNMSQFITVQVVK